MTQKPKSRKSYSRLKAWREQNPEKLKAQRDRYRERNKALGKIRYRKNKDQTLVRQNEWQRENYAANQAKYLVRGAKRRAKQRGLKFDLEDHITDLQNIIDTGLCELTGLSFVTSIGKPSPFSPSLDRKNSKAGYTRDNIRVVIWAANRAMGVWGFDLLAAIVDGARAKSRQEVL